MSYDEAMQQLLQALRDGDITPSQHQDMLNGLLYERDAQQAAQDDSRGVSA